MPKSIPADLQKTIDEHMRLFAGFQMVAEDPKGPEGESGDEPEPGEEAKPDDVLGEAGKAALVNERKARKLLEKQVTELAGVKEKFDAMTAAMAGKVEGTPEDAVKALTDKVAALEHQTLVERIARDNKITSDEDVQLLSAMRSDKEIRALAKRLASTENPEGDKGTKKPRPDPSQGHGGGDGAKQSGVSAGRDLFKESHPSKTN